MTKLAKMTNTDKQRLASIPVTRCAKCRSKRSYGNPMAKCYQCGKKFCFDDIWGGLYRKGMGLNESLRDVCDKCKEKFNYKQL